MSHDLGASEKSLGDYLPVDMLPVLTFLLGPLPWQFRVLVRAHGVRSWGGGTGCGTLSAVARLWRVEGNGLAALGQTVPGSAVSTPVIGHYRDSQLRRREGHPPCHGVADEHLDTM